MEEIYKKILLLIHSTTQLSGICYKYKDNPTEKNGDKLIEIIDKCEKKLLKAKEEIVIMVRKVEEVKEIKTVETENGFLIKEK